MKRLTVFLLSFALLLSFTACAAEENPQTEATTEPVTSTLEQAEEQPASDAKILIATSPLRKTAMWTRFPPPVW